MQARRNFVVVVVGQPYQHRHAPRVRRSDVTDQNMEILAQLISACLTVTAWDSDSSPYCVPVPVLLVGTSIGTTVLVPVLLVLLLYSSSTGS